MDFTGIISMWSLWLLLTIALGIFEIFTMSAIALCLAVATASGLIAALLGASPEWQLLTVALAAVLALIFVAPFARRLLKKSAPSDREAASNMDALIGRRITLPADLAGGGTVRVKIDGDSWQVKAADPQISYDAGTQMIVCGYDSIVLLVSR
ncbi:MAG: NfeD family protein [Bacteroidales bacterium]|nr:NfeD family protein [Bacteroidales bacterium]